MMVGAMDSPATSTEYGTTAILPTSYEQRVAADARQRRRRAVRWGVTALTVGAGVALLAMGGERVDMAANVHNDLSTRTSTAKGQHMVGSVPVAQEGEAIQCWQSAVVDGETRMMERMPELTWTKTSTHKTSSSSEPVSTMRIDTNKQFQEILGFGGAFTEAASLQFQKLPADKQDQVLALYFDKKHGSGYEFGRVPMGSSDFSVASYNHDDVANDTTLEHFDMGVTHDAESGMISFIQRAVQKNPALKLFLSPWSPPGWMKRPDPWTNYQPSMLGTAIPVGLKDDFRATWALYFSKFITAYKTHGLSFWGLTPQNEPQVSVPWESCGFDAPSQADFVGNFLGPVIRRDHPEVKIMAFDHNRGGLLDWATTIMAHPTAKDYVDGFAFHWYDNERNTDGVELHERLNDTHHVAESRFLMATESSNCPGVAKGTDAWFRGQRYAHDIMADFHNWVVGWVDWNLLLDHTGGPNHLDNNCDAPIILDESEQDFFIQPMYYFIQHFSKFVPTGSRRVHLESTVRFDRPGEAQLLPRYPAKLQACDGSARQQIVVTKDNKLQIRDSKYCIDLAHPQWIGDQVMLVECVYTTQQWTFVDGQVRMGATCLQLNHGSTQDGVALTAGACVEDAEEGATDYQRWAVKNGMMQSLASSDKCITAGYAFVQSVAFVTPENKKVAVVLNENTEDIVFDLHDGDMSVTTSVPRGAIRTFTWQ